MEVYLVGGAVRDLLLGIPSSDRDYVVLHGDEKALMERFSGLKKIGRNNPIYIRGKNQYTLSPAPGIVEDLRKRDLTINAFAQDESCRVIGLKSSWRDLEKRILRPVQRSNFFDDPVRVYRAARFAACFPDHVVSRELEHVMRDVSISGALADISPERVGQEVIKALECPCPDHFFSLLLTAEGLGPWFAELKPRAVTPGFMHALRRLSGCGLRVWMGVCHKLSWPVATCGLNPGRQESGHDRLAAQRARTMGERLKLPKHLVKAGAVAAGWFRTGVRYGDLNPKDRVDLLGSLDAGELTAPFFAVIKAVTGHDYGDEALDDLQRMLAVTLPPELREQGALSGKWLRLLRCCAVDRSELFGSKIALI